MAKRQTHDLVALVHDVQTQVNGLPVYDWHHPEPYRSAEHDVVDDLRKKGARITEGSNGISVTFGGVRSGSTGGNAAALKNWLGAARRKLDQQAIARMGE